MTGRGGKSGGKGGGRGGGKGGKFRICVYIVITRLHYVRNKWGARYKKFFNTQNNGGFFFHIYGNLRKLQGLRGLMMKKIFFWRARCVPTAQRPIRHSDRSAQGTSARSGGTSRHFCHIAATRVWW
jgi:hypothetical protein